jgi:arylsulfatase A
MHFSPIFKVVIALMVSSLVSIGHAAVEINRPNTIVVFIDDMGYGDTYPFGSKINRTPNLDRMASEGVNLTNFYAAPVCSASRAQLMTGCYAKRISIQGALDTASAIGLNPRGNTIASLLKRLRYSTMCIGKWHLGDQSEFLPKKFGLDHYLGIPYSHDMGGGGARR